jgi:two-component system, NarL family, response regulator DesR
MPNDGSTVLIRSMHPALEGVVRLSAGGVSAVDHVVAVEAVDLPGALRAAPGSIVVVDLDATATLTELRTIAGLGTDARIVVLADRDWPGSSLTAIRLGVRGFVRVPEALDTLSETLRRVARGERAIPSEIEQAAIAELGRCVQRARVASREASIITSRERQVLELLADGLTMRQIGRRLSISPRTVEAHTGKLYRKLTVRSRVEAIRRGSALGLIELG